MARKKVVEINCDRCSRVEYLEEEPNKSGNILHLRFHNGESVIELSYEDLCGPCVRTVQRKLEEIAKDIKGRSPNRDEAKKESSSVADTIQRKLEEAEESAENLSSLDATPAE